MYHPRGVAIDKARIQIVVANYVNNRIDVFSETGEYICQLAVGYRTISYDVALHGDSVYLSCEITL